MSRLHSGRSSWAATPVLAEPSPPGVDRAVAVREVGHWLVDGLGAVALSAAELAPWRTKNFENGWRLHDVATSAGPVTLDLLVDNRFPRSRPRVAWVDAPPFPSLPHVEDDGLVCVLSSSDSIDPRDPVALAKRVLGGAAEVLEEGLAGSNEEDFRTEFLSYWNPGADGTEMVSLLDPCSPSRPVTAWRSKRGMLVAEGPAAVRVWLQRAYGKRAVASSQLHRGLMLWLPAPLLPAAYPASVPELRALAASLGAGEADRLDALLARGDRETVIVLGAPVGDGTVFAGILVRRNVREGARHGFRQGKVPVPLMLIERRRDEVQRSKVDRADSWWVHGRDGNADLTELLASTVRLLGCGSLGSPVARLLAAAGVGAQVLIDPETLTRANTGRHVLGAGNVDRLKAIGLRDRLARDFPHLAFDAVADRWQPIARDRPELLDNCNLLVSTIGGWNDERELNDWHVAGHYAGTILYGWSEARGVAGQAVLVGPDAGCLACGMDDHGDPRLSVASFDRQTLRRETACGNFFQPYGAAEIEAIAILVADLAIDLLLGRVPPGTHRLKAVPAQRLADVGGTLTPAFIELSGGRTRGGNQEETVWHPRQGCPACAGRGS